MKDHPSKSIESMPSTGRRMLLRTSLAGAMAVLAAAAVPASAASAARREVPAPASASALSDDAWIAS